MAQRELIPAAEAAKIRATRSKETWIRYDTILVYDGASVLDQGWYDSFAGMAGASRLVWFGGRNSSVGEAWTNQNTEREDWAFDCFEWGIEFLAPVGNANYDEQAGDVAFWPSFWVQELPRGMNFRLDIANSDNLATIPGNYAPPGYGARGAVADGAGAQLFAPGNQGDAHVSNTYKFGDPLMIPASAQIRVTAQIDDVYRSPMRGAVGCPGFKGVPCGGAPSPTLLRFINVFGIRVFLRGFRYLQQRGARSAS